MILLILKIVCGILGGSLLYIAFFLYENEEKILVDRIQNLWISFDSKHKFSKNRLSRLIRNMSSILEKYVLKLFGTRLLSFKSFWVSSFLIYSFPFLLASTIGFIEFPWGSLIFIVSLLFIFIAHLPIIIPKKLIQIGCLAILILFLLAQYMLNVFWKVFAPTDAGANLKLQILAFTAMFLACILFLVIIQLIKYFLNYLKKSSLSLFNVIAIVLVLVISVVITKISYAIFENNYFENKISEGSLVYVNNLSLGEQIDLFFLFISYFSFGAFFPIWLLFFIIIINPIHTIFWNSLNRSLYSVHRYKLFSNKKFLIGVAVVLLTIAIPELGGKLLEISKILKEIN